VILTLVWTQWTFADSPMSNAPGGRVPWPGVPVWMAGVRLI